MANMYEKLRKDVVTLYNLKGNPGDLKRFSEIYEAINAADNYSRTLNATVLRLNAENEELKKEIEALKGQAKKVEEPVNKQNPDQTKSGDDALAEMFNSLIGLVMESFMNGDPSKK